MFHNKRINNKGVTLLEVIIAIALVSLVTAIGYSLLHFGNVTFANSNTQFGIQNDIRLTSSYLSKEIRFATEVKVMSLSECEAEIASHAAYNYFYIKNDALNQAIYVNPTIYTNKAFSNTISSTNSSFSKDVSANNILNLTLTANDNGKQYNISTDIVLENFPIINSALVIEGSTGLAIRYKTQDPQLTLIPVTSITINGGTSISTPNGSLDLDVVVTESNASIKTVLWSVNDSNLASVDGAGIVRAKVDGNAVITALAADGSGVNDIHNITITNQSAPTPTTSPTPTSTPIPTFGVTVKTGSSNTTNSFEVDFGATKVTSGVLIENKAGMTITFTYTKGPSKKDGTISMTGNISDNDWIKVTFTSDLGTAVTKVFEYDSITTDWSIFP